MASKALIIEDDLDTASLYGHILEFMGFETEIIRSGEQAMARLRQIVPDIVLLDMRLSPNVSGLSILNYVKGEKRLKTSSVIVVTGHPNLAESVEKKADMVFIKPISAKQLSTIVLRLCPNHASESFLYSASHDPLTGLMNSIRFKDRVAHAESRSKRTEGLTFAIIFLQVKNLETLKETYEQQGVNQALVDLVGRLKGQIRDVDTFSRLREDTFGILLENIQDPANIEVITTRIKKVLSAPFQLTDQLFDINIWTIHENLMVQLEVVTQSLD